MRCVWRRGCYGVVGVVAVADKSVCTADSTDYVVHSLVLAGLGSKLEPPK